MYFLLFVSAYVSFARLGVPMYINTLFLPNRKAIRLPVPQKKNELGNISKNLALLGSKITQG